MLLNNLYQFNEYSMLDEPRYEYPELIDKNLDRETKKGNDYGQRKK